MRGWERRLDKEEASCKIQVDSGKAFPTASTEDDRRPPLMLAKRRGSFRSELEDITSLVENR